MGRREAGAALAPFHEGLVLAGLALEEAATCVLEEVLDVVRRGQGGDARAGRLFAPC